MRYPIMSIKEEAKQIYQESIVIDGHFAVELAMPGQHFPANRI